MPFVHITLVKGRPPAEKEKILRSVHDALVATGQREEAIRVWITEVPPAEFLVGGSFPQTPT